MSTWKLAWLSVGLSSVLSAQQGGVPGPAAFDPLTPAQQTCVNRWIDIICCMVDNCFPWLATQVPGDHIACDTLIRVPYRLDPRAEGGMFTGPDKPGPVQPFVGGVFEGANGDSPNPEHDPGANNPICMDPGSFTTPDPNGDVYFDPGSGPRGNEGRPARVPGSTKSKQWCDLIMAGLLYGELGHQDLGCTYGDWQPATPEDKKQRLRSEARVHRRASDFFLWLWRCDGCWPAGIPIADVPKFRRLLLERAGSFQAAAEEFDKEAERQ